MDRVQQILVRKGDANYEPCAELCSRAKRLGNCVAYHLRHLIFSQTSIGTKTLTDQDIRALYTTDYRAMPSAASAQRMTQIVFEQFISYFAAEAAYKKDPSKFTGKPKLPGYAKKYRTFYVGRNGYKIENGLLTITGGKKVGLQPIKVTCCQDQPFNEKAGLARCGDLRICPKANCFVIEITYQKGVNLNHCALLNANDSLLVDLGVDNIAACISTKSGVPPLLVKGGALKSINQWYNKRMAALQAKGKFHHMAAVALKRNNRIGDCVHKIAHIVVSYCLAYDLGRIVIGQNPNWKQGVNIGKVNNQKFCYIPHAKLIDNIKYLAEEYGINVIVREESYTSKASALDFDNMPPFYQEGAKCQFSGERIKRGLYRSKSGKVINADLNGALNIGRKELGDEWLRILLANRGLVEQPVVIRNLHAKADCGALLKVGQRSCGS